MLIVNQLIPCDYSDTNVSMEMSSDSSGESQDLGEVNTGLKMAYFPNVSRPQWVNVFDKKNPQKFQRLNYFSQERI